MHVIRNFKNCALHHKSHVSCPEIEPVLPQWVPDDYPPEPRTSIKGQFRLYGTTRRHDTTKNGVHSHLPSVNRHDMQWQAQTGKLFSSHNPNDTPFVVGIVRREYFACLLADGRCECTLVFVASCRIMGIDPNSCTIQRHCSNRFRCNRKTTIDRKYIIMFGEKVDCLIFLIDSDDYEMLRGRSVRWTK
jgi:hypothetical protein